MPAIPQWVVYAAAVVFPILAFAVTPPSIWVNRLISSLSIHPTFDVSRVTSVNVYGTELRGRDRDRFLHAFNQADFLFERGMIPELNYNPIFIRVKEGKRMFEFTAYLYGDGMVQMVRHKRKKNVPYRVSSQQLELVLQSCVRDPWWVS